MKHFMDDLAGRLHRLLHQPNDEANVREVVQECYRIALASLRRKQAAGRKYPEWLGIKIQQLSWDCVADIFRRDESGHFSEFHRFFDDYPLHELHHGEIHSLFRCFVCNKTNDRIFQLMREHDPELGKLIRNIKCAIRGISRAYLTRYEDSTWMVVKGSTSGDAGKLQIPPEHLEARLTGKIYSNKDMSQIIGRCVDIIEASEYQSSYPVIGLAMVIRSYFSRQHSEFMKYSDPLAERDTFILIDHAVTDVRQNLYPRYVATNKINETTFDLYFDSIREVLLTKVKDGDAYSESLFNRLQSKDEYLSRKEYNNCHRSKIEYIYGKVTQKLKDLVKKENKFFRNPA